VAKGGENAAVRDVKITLEFLRGESRTAVKQETVSPGRVTDIVEE
jgi:hypothetical protein